MAGRLIEYPVLVGVPKERDLSVSASEQAIAAQPSRLTVVDGDGGKRIFCLHAIEKNDRNAVSAKFRQNRLKVEGWSRIEPSIRREMRL